jgi:hypothetical protein
MGGDAGGAITVLKEGLADETNSFAQADTLVCHSALPQHWVAHISIACLWIGMDITFRSAIWRSSRELHKNGGNEQLVCASSSAMIYMSIAMDYRSHATYYYLAAGCYFSAGNLDKAQEIFDQVPDHLDKRKMGGKELPMEVFIRKKRTLSPFGSPFLNC